MKKVTIKNIKDMKKRGKKIVVLTAYDYPLAKIMDESDVDVILVGDSLANVVLGMDSTKEVSMDEMISHTKAARRAVKRALLVGDMPYEGYQKNLSKALFNAKRFMNEAGCDAVKIEWFDGCLNVAKKLIAAGIPVMGHVGLTPQRADELGGYKVQGRDESSAQEILESAIALQKVGCFGIVLECIPEELAKKITKSLKIPTIGIGAGVHCDGQVLVSYDLLGLFDRYQPKFVKQYVNLKEIVGKAVSRYSKEVRQKKFPDKKHSFHAKI